MSAVRIFRGEARTRAVTVDGQPLPLHLELRKASPTGHEWGYGGSGPAQLALAILAECIDDDEEAVRLHQDFKWEWIAQLEQHESWEIRSDDVRAWVGRRQADKAHAGISEPGALR